MAKLTIQVASTSQTVNLFIQDSSSSTGAGLTGLVFNTASLVAYYALPRAAAVQITLATLAAVTSAYSSGGFKEIDATNMPGWYRFDIPDAALASGRFVSIHLKGATNMAPLPLEIELTGWNNQDAVRGGLTALPNAAAAASGGLPILGANATAISFTGGMTISNAGGDALTLSSGGSNGVGLSAAGNGTGAGIRSTGGTTGHGVSAVGGATSGDGISAAAATSGHGLTVTGVGTTKHGVNATGGSTTSHGIAATGGGVGHGILATSGGGATGDGIRGTAASTNGNGINGIGVGTGAGALATGGATGHGISAVGGATSGSGVSAAAATSGDGITATGVGTTKHGLNATGGSNTSDGIRGTGGGAGHGLNLVAGVTGNGMRVTTTAGDGISVVPTAGHAMALAGNGTTKHGLHATGGATTSHGINAVGGGVGHGILATSGGGATGDGIRAAAASTNGNGVNYQGVGTGAGEIATGGATGHGIQAVGGATSGDGLNAAGATSGHGISAAGVGTTKHGLAATGGSTSSDGIRATGGGTGNGLNAISGSGATGDGIAATAASTNGRGVLASGTGTGGGVRSVGGATGNGVTVVGGATSGDGINVTTVSGHGINLAPVGTSKHGLFATGGNGGTSDGISAVAGTGGVPIRGDLTGNITGNLSGSAGSVTGAVGSVASGGIASASFAAGAINAAAIATDAITAAKIAADAIGASELAADAVTEIQSGLATSAALATVQADTDDIQTRLPAALVSGRIDASVGAVAANAITAAAVADGAIDRATFAADTGLVSIRSNTAQAGGASTITLDASASATDNIFRNLRILLTGGTGIGQVGMIRSYVGATKVATVTPAWTTVPDNTTTFAIIPATSAWDEFTADHLTALTTGSSLNAAGSAGDPWGTAIPGAYGAGTAGHRLGNVPDLVAGAAGGIFIAGSNAATTVNITGNVTGNLSGSVGSVTGAVGSVTAGVTLAPSAVQAIWDALTSALTTAGSIGKRIADFLTGDAYVRLGAPAGASVSADVAAVQADTDNIQTRLPAALVSGRIDASVGDMATGVLTATAIATDAITAAKIAADAIGSSELAATAVNEIADQVWDEVLSGHLTAGTTGAGLNAAGSAGDPWSTALPGAYGAGTAGAIVGSLSAVGAGVTSLLARLGAWTGTGMNTVLGALRAMANKAAALTPTDLSSGGTYDNTTDSQEAIRDAFGPTPPTAVEIADAFLDRDMSLGTDSGSTTVRTPRQALRALRNKRSRSGLVVQVYKENDTTVSWSAAIVTSPTAEIITEVDPAG